MTDRPILFSAPMIRALLDGRKTQTRRVLKPQPGPCTHKPYDKGTAEFRPSIDDDGLHCAECGNGLRIANTKSGVRGIPVRFRKGDRLWVKETHRVATWNEDGDVWMDYNADGARSTMLTPPDDDFLERLSEKLEKAGVPTKNGGFYADDIPERLLQRVSIHMPRWASRLTLTVTDVRVQRLQECSEADAIAEGIERRSTECSDGVTRALWYGVPECGTEHAVTSYGHLWDSINNPRALCPDDAPASWAANPWIVALTFTVERRNIDAIPLEYLIWSNVHRAWWGPNRAGYCTEISGAGRYTREEAIKQCAYGRDGFTTGRVPPELPVREIDAINQASRRIVDLVLKADRAECRARDLASKARAA